MSKGTAKAATNSRKMAVLVTCYKCKKSVNAKNTILCSECDNKFEFECGGIAEKVYRLMEPESREKWRCKVCVQKANVRITSSEASNITSRKKPSSSNRNDSSDSIRFSTPASELSQMNDSHILSTFNTSCDSPLPLSRSVDNTLSDSNSVQEMKENINMLTSQLASTQIELENTILENNDLHRQNNKLTRENELLKTLCQRPLAEINKIDNNKTKKKRRCSSQFPEIKRALFASPGQQSLTKNDPTTDDFTVFQSLQLRITELSNKLQNAEREISCLRNKMLDPPNDPQNFKLKTTIASTQKPVGKMTSKEEIIKPKQYRKVCLLSTNKVNNTLALADNCLGQNSKICHFLKPGSTIGGLLDGITIKLAEFTMNDFCIILIGEEEFRSTHDYFSTITLMRETLSKIKHTNLIICLPTYKYGELRDMYNWRIENFNNLLYLDIITHEHAYLFDSNENLKYDHTMFDRRSGKINNLGMRSILNNLGIFMNTFQTIHVPDELQYTPDDTEYSTFFRD